jgi:NAD(P)-dependent dehydrogenase (short-subunit alcohol dehydrogenase family)
MNYLLFSQERKMTRNAYIITGPTSGIGRATALEMAKHGQVILVGRDRGRLDEVQAAIQKRGGVAVSVLCDLADLQSVKRAASEILALGLPITSLVNNAGVMLSRDRKTAQGLDLTYVTNHLGPFALTEALLPHLPSGANVLFVTSAVEDPGRKPAVAADFRGSRYVSVEANARGEWKPGGSSKPGMDAYATSKQASLATALAFSREYPRLRVNAIEPGFMPTTGLSRDSGAFVRMLTTYVVPLLVPLLRPFIKILSTPKYAARVITKIMTHDAGPTGVYFNERGQPMQGSPQVSEATFQDHLVAETRAFLAQESARA